MRVVAREALLDVSTLEPPEPLQQVLAATDALRAGQYLRVRHRREPYPLYAILEELGFSHLTRVGSGTPFEIFIWKRGDEDARSAVQRLCTRDH